METKYQPTFCPSFSEVCSYPHLLNVCLQTDNLRVYKSGDQVDVVCDAGLAPAAKTTICQPNRTWDPEPVCSIIECTPPSSIEHGSLSPILNSYVYRTRITLTCDNGYEAEHRRATLTCLHDGTWDFITLKCVEVHCDDTSDVQLNVVQGYPSHDVVQGYPTLAFGQIGEATYNSTLFNLKNGSLQLNCSAERKLFWINAPEFGKNVFILAYGTSISASTSGAGKGHLTPPCKTSRVR